jgi:hypothetical protein
MPTVSESPMCVRRGTVSVAGSSSSRRRGAVVIVVAAGRAVVVVIVGPSSWSSSWLSLWW